MKNIEVKNVKETHPLFPSGDWEGFYTYAFGPEAAQHRMAFYLDFHNNLVKGTGSDDVGGFFWDGEYDKENMRCSMIKSYSGHTVRYTGRVDENGIWGTWEMVFMKGGFHIWPKGSGNQNYNEEKESISLTSIKEEIETIKAPDELKRWIKGLFNTSNGHLS